MCMIACAADALGAATAVMNLAVEYAKVRRQFDQPIGSFQAVQHLCVDMYEAVELARSGVIHALWAADAAEPAERHRAALRAKAFAGRLASVGDTAIQVFGGIGFTWEHDAHLYLKRLLGLERIPRRHPTGTSRRSARNSSANSIERCCNDVLPGLNSGDSNPNPIDLCGRSRELRFTVRRPPSGEVSRAVTARPAAMLRAAFTSVLHRRPCRLGTRRRLALAVSGCDVPARGTTLRRIRGRDQLDPGESLVLQTSDQHTPTTTADSAVQPTFLSDSHARLIGGAARRAGHRTNIKGLDPDQVESPREVGGGLLHRVLTPIPLAGLQLSDRAFRLFAAVGASLGSGESLLQHLQPLRSPGVRLGTCRSSRWRARQTRPHRGRCRHTAVAGPVIGSGMWANATCQRPARSRVTR